MSAAIEARDVFRLHGSGGAEGAVALQGLTLTVQHGEVIVVLGPSGSGKSTLLRILAGLDRPSAGTVRVFGDDLGAMTRKRLDLFRSRELGYVDQHYVRSLAPELDAAELVGLQLGLTGVEGRERRRRVAELLERVGLGDRGRAHPGELSGGEQQRVAVSAALAHRPRLLLADEPTGELDAVNADGLYRLIGELARETGSTTVIVSHDPESAAIADRVVHVRDGRLAGEQAREDGGEESIVVGRGGWVRLPEELLLRSGIGARARARVSDGGIVVSAVAGETASGGAVRRVVRLGGGAVVAEGRSLHRRFGDTDVLGGLVARFEGGRLTVVTGPSGSGKTTLLHLLAGLDVPDEGEVDVLGTEVSALDREARAAFRRGQIGLVTQEPGLTPFLSARENVELALALRGKPDPAAARGALASVGLAEHAERRVEALSAGERQRVAIARAVAVRPALLLADEPTARLDQANALAVARLLAELAHETGAAVVVATHDGVVIGQADEELALRRDQTATAASSPARSVAT